MMRLPRVRLAMSTLLVLVAAVAVNCSAWRFLVKEERNYRWQDRHWRLLDESLIGFLPLINVALIGCMLFAIDWLRVLRRRGERSRDRLPPPTWTYFSLHFALIAFLLIIFMPEAFENYGAATFRPIWAFLEARSWAKNGVLDENIFSPTLFESTLDMGLYSGPILALAWICRLLARRYYSRAPRRRLWAMTCLVSSGFAAAGLAIVTMPRAFADEVANVALAFNISDRDSGRPIPSAFVRLIDPFDADSIPSCAFADANGRAELTVPLEIAGERNLFRRMGVILTWGRWLEVAASGYQKIRLALPEVLGPSVDLESLATGKVTLAKGKTLEPHFRDLAGSYRTPKDHYSGHGIEIDPDGRFIFSSWSCTHYFQDYGYLRRHEGEIAFIPIPRPGREATGNFRCRTIQWGDRQYLSTTDASELRNFCREALAPNNPKSYRLAWSMVRESDQEKPRTGWPQLPAHVWVRYVFDEINLRNEEGLLRLWLDSLIPRIFRWEEDAQEESLIEQELR